MSNKVLRPSVAIGMEWTRSQVISRSDLHCASCHGLGLVGRDGNQPCPCVLRAIFRECLRKYNSIGVVQNCSRTAPSLSHVNAGNRHALVFGRRAEEYRADFYLAAKRSLAADEWNLFKVCILGGNAWRHCCEVLKLAKGEFFHKLYRIQARLGRVLAELKPCAVHPINEYYSRPGKGCEVIVIPASMRRNCCTLNIPLQVAA